MLSSILTLPFAFKTFKLLLYLKLSASNLIPSSVVIIPLFDPLKIFPFSKISTSVTSKLKDSSL